MSKKKTMVWEDFGTWEANHREGSTAVNKAEFHDDYAGEEEDSILHQQQQKLAPCKVIIRSRHASTTWERLVKSVVGDPVHLDVVLVKEGSAGARFCFSSYMNQKFEMVMMDKALIHDDNMKNMVLSITDDEHERCMRFMMSLVEKASYDYFDAMVLMPMAPKAESSHKAPKLSNSFFNVLVEDADAFHPEHIKKVFCSQSVVLMLRNALDPGGKHAGLLKTINTLNSKLVSPKQVHCLLSEYGAASLSNQDLWELASA